MDKRCVNLFVALLVMVSLMYSTAGAFPTNNVTDFDPNTNIIAAGRWSYLIVDEPWVTDPTLMTEHNLSEGNDNWWWDNGIQTNTYYVTSTGDFKTDEKDIIFSYAVGPGENGEISVQGVYNGADGHVRIIRTSDADPNVINMFGHVVFWDTAIDGDCIDLKIVASVGDDIMFFGETPPPANPFAAKNLNVTLSPFVPGLIASNGATNNVADFDPTTNQIAGGRWSYLWDHKNFDPPGPELMTEHNPGEPADNWWKNRSGALNSNFVATTGTFKVEDVSRVFYNYTIGVGEDGSWEILGTFDPLGDTNGRVRIIQTTDTCPGSFDVDFNEPNIALWDSATDGTDINLAITAAVGNDILIECTITDTRYWVPANINVSIFKPFAIYTPSAGEALVATSPYDITWEVRPSVSHVDIELSTDGGANWQPVVSNLPNSGFFRWQVFEPLLMLNGEVYNNVKLAITDVAGSGNSGVSDAFAIYECLLLGDVTHDCRVLLDDLNALIGSWLNCVNPFNPAYCDQFAPTWSGPTFREFSGTNQGDAFRSIYTNAVSWTRSHGFEVTQTSIAWEDLEPFEPNSVNHVWNQQYLDNFGARILTFREEGAFELPILVIDDPTMTWPAGGGEQIGTDYVEDWKNYVERVVRFLRKAPYNVEYFQIWNEPYDTSCGHWNGTLYGFITNVHLPAAEVIHALGGKVVYGGWPTCGTIAEYAALLDAHNAWETIDVLSAHYRSNDYTVLNDLWNEANNRGFPDMQVWVTEVGFASNVEFITSYYPSAFYDVIANNYDSQHDFKLMYYAEQSPNDPNAFGYHKTLYSGESLYNIGITLQTLADLLDGTAVSAYTNTTNDRGLTPGTTVATDSGLETFQVDSTVIVSAVHVKADEVVDPATDTITISYPEFTSPAQIASIERVDMAGYTTAPTSVVYAPGLQVTVPVWDDAASPVRTTWGYGYPIYHCYVKVTKN